MWAGRQSPVGGGVKPVGVGHRLVLGDQSARAVLSEDLPDRIRLNIIAYQSLFLDAVSERCRSPVPLPLLYALQLASTRATSSHRVVEFGKCVQHLLNYEVLRI